MFSLLESKSEIAQAQRRLEATIRRQLTRTVTRNIGFPGDTARDAKVRTDGRYWFRGAPFDGRDVKIPRRLNWFGLYQTKRDLEISVEINTPYEGRVDQIAGFFARDSTTGIVYLFHSGKIGGGTKGVGKTTFLAWFNEKPVIALDAQREPREGIVVMPIDGEAALRPAIRYIDAIARFKLAVRAGETNEPAFRKREQEFRDFQSESSGRRKGSRSSEIDYLSRHGEVVDALKIWRTESGLPEKAQVVNTVLIDLGVVVDDHLIEVFEVKTNTTRSDIYGAIGQLLVHGTSTECRRVLVLPDHEAMADDLDRALRRIGIEVVKFRLSATAALIL